MSVVSVSVCAVVWRCHFMVRGEERRNRGGDIRARRRRREGRREEDVEYSRKGEPFTAVSAAAGGYGGLGRHDGSGSSKRLPVED